MSLRTDLPGLPDAYQTFFIDLSVRVHLRTLLAELLLGMATYSQLILTTLPGVRVTIKVCIRGVLRQPVPRGHIHLIDLHLDVTEHAS